MNKLALSSMTLRRPESERGFSLPEMIVAMALLSVAMTLVVTLSVTFSTNFTRERAATDSTNVASSGMNSITKVIRSGTTIDRTSGNNLPVFVKSEATKVVLHSYLADSSSDPAPILVRISIDAGRQLIEDRWNATRVGDEWIFPALGANREPIAAPVSSRVIARLIEPGVTVFTYLDSSGTPLTAPVASADLGNIASVEVYLRVQADQTERAAPVELRNRVGLPNLSASRLGLEG